MMENMENSNEDANAVGKFKCNLKKHDAFRNTYETTKWGMVMKFSEETILNGDFLKGRLSEECIEFRIQFGAKPPSTEVKMTICEFLSFVDEIEKVTEKWDELLNQEKKEKTEISSKTTITEGTLKGTKGIIMSYEHLFDQVMLRLDEDTLVIVRTKMINQDI